MEDRQRLFILELITKGLYMESHLYQDLYDLENEHWWFISKRKIVLALLGKYLPANITHNILDVGCGSGLMLNDLTRFGNVSGMDYSEDALRFSSMSFDGVLRRGYLPGGMPFPENHFDVIVALDILEHIEDDIASLQDIKNHLKDGGICLVTVPAHMFLWSGHDVVHDHKRRYTKEMLRERIELAGLSILKLSYYNSLLFVPITLTRMAHRLMKKEYGSDAQMPNKYANMMLQRIFSFEALCLDYFDFRTGVSLIAVLTKQ